MLPEPEFIPWLLNAATPAIRYLTLVDLLDLPEDDGRVVQARLEIMQTGAVPAILSRQLDSGQWNGDRSFYTPKYTSACWSMQLLTELGADGRDPRFQRGAQHILDTTAADLRQRLETNQLGWSCFWGNMLRYTLHAGAEPASIENLIHYATRSLQDDACRCVHNGGSACAWGVVRTLWGLAAIPPGQRTPAIDAVLTRGTSFLLDSFQLAAANYPVRAKGSINSLWFKLNFPLFYQADILFTLRVLDELEMLEYPGAQAALDWLAQQQEKNGRWSGCSPFRQRTWRELGGGAETDRWVSLHASRILRRAGRIPLFHAD